MSWILIFIIGGLGSWLGGSSDWDPESGGFGPSWCIRCGVLLGGVAALILVAILGSAAAGFGLAGIFVLAFAGGWFGGPLLTSALGQNELFHR